MEFIMSKQKLKTLKAVRSIERSEHFARGGTLTEWMGGARTITRNKKQYTRKGKSKWRQ